MSTIEILSGTVEHGMIRLDQPLDLPEGQMVHVQVIPVKSPEGLTTEDNDFLLELMQSRSKSRTWNNG